MRRRHVGIAATASLAAGLLAAAPVLAAETRNGSILVGNPATLRATGVNEYATPCDESAPRIDGQWFKIPSGNGHVSIDPAPTLDVVGYFYTAKPECGYIEDRTLTTGTGLGVDEDGQIPSTAAWVVVEGFGGAGSFTITFS